ncbi:hypothetical protein Btru_060449 [Bulinus truncatus]|nr:hypothetical protein Btru_060449 [Bulinus truncatus]
MIKPTNLNGNQYDNSSMEEEKEILQPKATPNSNFTELVDNLKIKVPETTIEKPKLIYRVSQVPPLHLLIISGLQHCLINIGSPLTITVLVSEVVCAQKDDYIKTQILSSSLFMIGLSTVVMTVIGVRLPIFQGPSSAYLIPLFFMSTLPEWKCPPMFKEYREDNTTVLMADVGNGTTVPAREFILQKLSQLSGSLMLAGGLHFIIGVTGLVGILIRFIGPLTVVPTVTLLGLNFYKVVITLSDSNWLIFAMTFTCNLVLALYLAKRPAPIPMWSRQRGFYILWFPLHQIFSVLISIIISWIFSVILTEAGTMSDDPNSKQRFARTDSRFYIVRESDWFTFPYPGQFGGFSFSFGGFVCFFMATMASVLDSVGDYKATARIVRVKQPPRYVYNRGLAVEGLMSLLSGAMGCCHATMSYSSNVGIMGLTKIVSRSVLQVCGLIYIAFAIFGKFGAFFLTIPYPVLGGTALVAVGIFVGLSLTYLQNTDFTSVRNMAILGISFLMGLLWPYWISISPKAINTGNIDFDNVIKMFLSNPSFIGGFLACFLDNTIPGTLKERGLLHQMKDLSPDSDDEEVDSADVDYEDGLETYKIPFIPDNFTKSKLAKWIPIF